MAGRPAFQGIYQDDVLATPKPSPQAFFGRFLTRMTVSKQPVLGLTLGDSAGIGPELVAQALKHFAVKKPGWRFRVIGKTDRVTPGKLSKTSARHALQALRESVELLRSGEIHAVVNGPVHKENLAGVGFAFPGQTEFYADAFGLDGDDVTMMLAADRFRVGLVTTHCSLREAVRRLSVARIVKKGRQVLEGLEAMGIQKPRLAVAGLNPHAGEGGRFGDEEIKMISPAVQALKSLGIGEVSGPFSPDAVYRSAWQGNYDAVLSMYHDQGLIPLKMVGFDNGVNVTLGLPYWRTAPDHGTAVDLAGKGIASPKSFYAAIRMAGKFLRRPVRQTSETC